MKKYGPVAMVLLCVCSSGVTAADIYTTIGGYYSKVEKPVDRAGSGGQFGIGYQLSDNWNVEIGYDQFIDQEPQWPNFGSGNDILFKSGYKSAGLSVSVLGKTAINEQNTLFYRVGAVHNKSSSLISYFGNTGCVDPAADNYLAVFIVNEVQITQVTSCAVSRTNTAFLFGVGVDHQFNQQWFSRVELVGLSDPDAKSLYALKLAVGYRF